MSSGIHKNWSSNVPSLGGIVDAPEANGYIVADRISGEQAITIAQKLVPESRPNKFMKSKRIGDIEISRIRERSGYLATAWPKGIGVIVEVDTTMGRVIVIEHAITGFRRMTKALPKEDC